MCGGGQWVCGGGQGVEVVLERSSVKGLGQIYKMPQLKIKCH